MMMKQMDMTAFCEGVGAGMLAAVLLKLIFFRRKRKLSKLIKRALRIAEGAVCAIGGAMGF
ncbi:MAG: hypothetical protein II443_06680 [Oscillospiraceae bacterium]|nr:hypothetical protein [Oscillospiraceae bacterium]MBQ2602996.1 hypothetical protein [Oscillospiraceae bacterium]